MHSQILQLRYILYKGRKFIIRRINTILEINVSNLSKGVYFVNIVGNNQIHTKKFIKE
ncbi:MAG TPA: T9SS type A sorting domain-containing protein [Flavobacteriaceae bacterium]|nr:T9SS type A sorting domain-containing protein [Flavobacteriaceae bacterium]HIP26347.1 T9SS type A sorting domain-containing protein [Flavobacteriaceae bacterium]